MSSVLYENQWKYIDGYDGISFNTYEDENLSKYIVESKYIKILISNCNVEYGNEPTYTSIPPYFELILDTDSFNIEDKSILENQQINIILYITEYDDKKIKNINIFGTYGDYNTLIEKVYTLDVDKEFRSIDVDKYNDDVLTGKYMAKFQMVKNLIFQN